MDLSHQSGSPAHCGWWPGDGAFADAHGSNDGANGGGVTFATGAVGNGFNLNGAATRVGNKTTLVTTVPTNALPLHIGADSAGNTRLSGVIDEPRIYNRALTANEILAIYRDGATIRCQQ